MASPEDALDTLDAADRSAVVVWQGEHIALPDPASLSWREVIERLDNPRLLATEAPGLLGIGQWRWALVGKAWSEAFDIGNAASARRLAYVMSHYGSGVEADFARWYPGIEAGALWRTRRWRMLLSLVDHLPQNTHYHQGVSQDEEHARMVIEAEKAAKDRGEEKPSGPSLVGWSPEVAALTTLIDAVKENTYTTVKVATDKGVGSPPKPMPRPTGVLERVRLRMRAEAHDILVRRMLPHLFTEDDQ